MEWWEITKNKEEIVAKFEDVLKGKKSFGKYQKEFLEFVRKDKSEASKVLLRLIEIIEEFNKDNRKIEDLKQKGLYVGFEKNKIFKPDDLKNFNIEEKLETYRWIIESTSPWMNKIKKINANDKKIKKMYKVGKALREFVEKFKKLDDK